ncbi:MAG: divalent-cation tolerance protein CutA [Burkholderiaceae bacterium]|jgi:periplasmic divalent cation tolerance protein|nr:divalent-cation tolerance protein CutA [Burkholderiaceae bacterium]
MTDVLLVYSTVPDEETAQRIARQLVEQRLAACVSCLPQVHSVYHWQGKVEEARETVLMIKTTRSRFQPMADRLRLLHPYDIPELIAVPVAAGLPDYLNWIQEETRG